MNVFIIRILFYYSVFSIRYSILKKCYFYFPLKTYNILIIINSVRKSVIKFYKFSQRKLPLVV